MSKARKRFNLKKLSPRYVFSKRRRLIHLKNHPLVVPVVTLIVLLAITGVGYVALGSQTVGAGDSHVVILSDNQKKQIVPTRATTVTDLLNRLHIKLNQGDVIEPDPSSAIVEDNFRVNVYRAQPVTIVDGGHRSFSFSAATTARSIAAQAGVTVYAEDNLQIQIPDKILHSSSIGREIVIDRAIPAYLNLYGTPVAVRTHAKTVAELLSEKKVKIAKSDTVQPAVTTPITAGISIVVSRQGTQIISVTEVIPTPIQIVEDPTLSFGATAIRQQGSPGKKLVTYQLNIKNGKEESRQEIQEIIAQQPVPEIIARGKAVYIPEDKSVVMAAAGISSSDYPYVNYIVSHESGWCPTKLQGAYGSCPGFAPSYIPADRGYGLGQATPGSKMSAFGSDWQTSSVTQLKWATSYADSRFGSWSAAYNYWLAHHNW